MTETAEYAVPGLDMEAGDHVCGFFGGFVLENPHYLTPDEFRALRA